MIHIFLVYGIFLLLLPILAISAIIGRHFGRIQIKKHTEHKLEVVSVAESAVFTLLALLIAFTFAGSYERYENRKIHILSEANAFDSGYESIDLTPLKNQESLRENVRKYLDLHIASYINLPYPQKVTQDRYKAIKIQREIWHTIIRGCMSKQNTGMCQYALQPILTMFTESHSGINLGKIHPPAIIFVMLISVAALGALLVGYNAAINKERYPIHILCYILLTTCIIYLIINLEYPRLGIMRFKAFDQMLIDVRMDMNHKY